MYNKKECVAMLLAGGQGSRLYSLTQTTAKPAVSFGGKYRIIDFPLSNCVNSGIDTVGVLTQYQPLDLNEYIGNGQPWDLDRISGGVTVLPPYQGKTTADWYKGTANAIYQNLNFIDRYNPDYVLVLSGDHIYKMDYSLMLAYHKARQAVCTIAVIDVDIEQASRFGILSTDEDGLIRKFEEKPKNPESTKASMGIYIFNKNLLFDVLQMDKDNIHSTNDFGKDIIPVLLQNNMRVYAYPFSGYWKDVGTVQSLWEANMDLLGKKPKFQLRDKSWRIYSRNYATAPHFIGGGGFVKNSLVTEGCEIFGTVEGSVLSNSVKVSKGAIVRDSVIMSDVEIREGAVVENAIVDSGAIIESHVRVGQPKESGAEIVLISGGSIVRAESN